MTGEVLKRKLDGTGLSQAEIARRLGVIPQSMTQYFKADDVRTGTLERLCEVLNKDMSFFYDIPSKHVTDEDDEIITGMRDAIEALQHENSSLKAELIRLENIKLPTKDSKVYNLWMKFMEITCEWQEMYKEEKECGQ